MATINEVINALEKLQSNLERLIDETIDEEMQYIERQKGKIGKLKFANTRFSQDCLNKVRHTRKKNEQTRKESKREKAKENLSGQRRNKK